LLDPSGKQSLSSENRNIDIVSRSIARICRNLDYRIILTHGNGSQVGNEIMRNEHAKKYVPKLPLYVINAETQALIGTMLETSLRNNLTKMKVSREVCMVLAHVIVNEKDPAFKRPTKPIGPFYTERELKEELALYKFSYINSSNGYRMVVASPKPERILEEKAIAAETGKNLVITCGGGGIPVVKRNGLLYCVDAVIDKDLTTQLLSSSIKAEKMVILTNAEYLYEDFEKRKGVIKEIKAKDLRKISKRFEEGTIKPKIDACISFIENGGKEAYIGNVFKLELILQGKSGTRIY